MTAVPWRYASISRSGNIPMPIPVCQMPSLVRAQPTFTIIIWPPSLPMTRSSRRSSSRLPCRFTVTDRAKPISFLSFACEAIAQEKMLSRLLEREQLAPGCIFWQEGMVIDERGARVVGVAPGKLRRERQEEFMDAARLQETGEDARATFVEDDA